MRWSEDYTQWYNHSHHRSSLAGFRPHQVFSGEHLAIAIVRQSALDEAYARHPERFRKGRPIVKMPLPKPASIPCQPMPIRPRTKKASTSQRCKG
jgi:putative transposase